MSRDRTTDFLWAFSWMMGGVPVRRRIWPEGTLVFIDKKDTPQAKVVLEENGKRTDWRPSSQDLLATDWA